ncbi:MAG: hypothetical protein ACXABK_02960 [Candidatus Heimdallarchaeaceae archaeon]|jgi:hypothetical protein
MLWVGVAFLFGLSFLIWTFLIFSLIKQNRYATLFIDMLQFYTPLNFLALLSILIGSYLILYIFNWTPPIWIVPLILIVGIVLDLILLYFFRRWRNFYKLEVYANFLEELKQSKYSVKLFKDYNQEVLSEKDKIHVFIRHDVDLSLDRLLEIVNLEKEKGIFSTLFFRLHSEKYSFEEAIPIIQHLYSEGFEIGFHYEVLSQTKGNTEEALNLFSKELNELRQYAPIKVAAHHGDKYSNEKIWSEIDKEKLDVWSAYEMKRDMYLTDTGGKDMYRQHGMHLFDKLKEAKAGAVIQILIHADWWY